MTAQSAMPDDELRAEAKRYLRRLSEPGGFLLIAHSAKKAGAHSAKKAGARREDGGRIARTVRVRQMRIRNQALSA